MDGGGKTDAAHIAVTKPKLRTARPAFKRTFKPRTNVNGDLTSHEYLWDEEATKMYRQLKLASLADGFSRQITFGRAFIRIANSPSASQNSIIFHFDK